MLNIFRDTHMCTFSSSTPLSDQVNIFINKIFNFRDR